MGRLSSDKWEGWRSLGAQLILMMPALWLFAPAFDGRQVLAFRDGAHYYYPLWHWMDAEWNAGRPPLWNPQENNGVSLAADPTAGLWYPGQLLLRLPCPFAACYHLFLFVHFVGAAWGAQAAARRLGVGRWGGIIAGQSYAYGGVVLFTYANPVYLVGAAWLPWGVAAVIRHLRAPPPCPSLRMPLPLVLPLVMLVLGGDPQTAVHLGLIAVAGLFLWRPVGTAHGEIAWRDRFMFVLQGLLSFGGAALLAATIAAIQVAPTLQSLDQTERVHEASSDRYWFGPLAAGTHEESRYEFSVGPWRWGELLWPNVSGRMFPTHRRWLSALPAEGRIWMPTLYAGVIPFALALCALAGRRTTPHVRWLAWTTALAALAACGHYGFGWLIHESTLWLTGQPRCLEIGAHLGGVYWLLTQIVPGYELFRYPGKWWTVAALGLSLLAATGGEQLWSAVVRRRPTERTSVPRGRSRAADPRRQRPAQSRIAIVSGCLLMLTGGGILGLEAWSYFGGIAEVTRRIPADDWWGPFDAPQAFGDVRQALTQTFVSVAVLLAVCRGLAACDSWRQAAQRRLAAGLCATLLIAWIGGDLVLANRWTLAWLAVDRFAIAPHDPESERPWGRWYRAASTGWWPADWRHRASAARRDETLKWEHESHFPKSNLLRGEWLASREDAWCVAEWRSLLDAASERGPLRPDGMREPAQNLLDALSVRWLALPKGVTPKYDRMPILSYPASSAPKYDRMPILSYDLEYQDNPRAFPRAWLVTQVEVFAGPLPSEPRVAAQRRRDIVAPGGSWRDFGATAVVEADRSPPALDFLEPSAPRATETNRPGSRGCRILEATPTRLVVEVDASRPALLVVNDAYDPDWKAERIEAATGVRRHVDVWRTNRVMRGVVVTPGKQRLEFNYRPWSVRLGICGSLVGCLAWLGTWWSDGRRQARERRRLGDRSFTRSA